MISQRIKHIFFIVMGMMMISLNSYAHRHSLDHFVFNSLMSDEKIRLSDYQGKVILIVNTASKCGFTGQYKGLEDLYQRFKNQGLVVIGVPSDDFGNQEFKLGKEIETFCRINYGVSFPMTKKYHVKGSYAHPFYQWARKEKGFMGAPKWNFHKYLINRQGELVNYFYSFTTPDARRLVSAVKAALDLKPDR